MQIPSFACYITLVEAMHTSPSAGHTNMLKAIFREARNFDEQIMDIVRDGNPLPPPELMPELEKALLEAAQLNGILLATDHIQIYNSGKRFRFGSRELLGNLE